VTSVTICGHSLDFVANAVAPFKVATVYTYASPKTGDPLFVNAYNHLVPDTSRIANRLDLVPKLPLPPLYDHAQRFESDQIWNSADHTYEMRHPLRTLSQLLSLSPFGISRGKGASARRTMCAVLDGIALTPERKLPAKPPAFRNPWAMKKCLEAYVNDNSNRALQDLDWRRWTVVDRFERLGRPFIS
jgi:hypothetical protein